MPRWMFFVPLAALISGSAALGLLLGQKTQRETQRGSETDVIVRIAETYVAEAGAGAARTDCTARPAVSEGLWLVIVCARPGAARREYFIDAAGRIAHRAKVPAQ